MFKNLHLLLSLLIVVPTAIIYSSSTILSQYLDIQVQTTDLASQMKAMAFLYLGLCGVWLLGIWKTAFWKPATQLNCLFMLTLALGRIVSVIVDGWPTGGYVFGLFAELILGLFSLYQLQKFDQQTASNGNSTG